ncbi:MAG: ABC transporter permease [Dehalococcoidia bacterium]|nr:ABC transporter permease [Dehalococcoidia bacterium]
MSAAAAGDVLAPRELQGPSTAARFYRPALRFIKKQPLGAFGLLIVIILVVLAALPSVIAPQRYDDFDVTARLQAPSMDYFFGTDQLGRDNFSRIIYASRTSVIIGFSAVLVAAAIATAVGVSSAYFGGWFDTVFQRLIDVWMSFPGLIFIVFVVAIFGNGRGTIILTLGLLYGAGSSRVIRSAALTVRSMSYIEAVRATGAGDLRIILRHVIPNVTPIIIVNASVQVGAVILAESSLSFLGFGTPPPFPSWGRMLGEAQTYMTQHPHLALFPGAAIALTVYGCNMLGDALRDTLDPRLRRGA